MKLFISRVLVLLAICFSCTAAFAQWLKYPTAGLPLTSDRKFNPSAPAPHISALRPRDAVAQLAACLFRIDPEDRSRLGAELSLLDRIAAGTVVARLSVPRRFDALPSVRAAIAADLDRR